MRRRPGELLANEVAILRALRRAEAEDRRVWSWLIWGEIRWVVEARTNSGVYRALERLRDMGLVASEWEGGHRHWRLTPDGRAKLEEGP
jgi:DNA-binding transcriptional ArsR family regulator